MPSGKKKIGFYLSPEDNSLIEQLREALGASRTGLIRQLLRAAIVQQPITLAPMVREEGKVSNGRAGNKPSPKKKALQR